MCVSGDTDESTLIYRQTWFFSCRAMKIDTENCLFIQKVPPFLNFPKQHCFIFTFFVYAC